MYSRTGYHDTDTYRYHIGWILDADNGSVRPDVLGCTRTCNSRPSHPRTRYTRSTKASNSRTSNSSNSRTNNPQPSDPRPCTSCHRNPNSNPNSNSNSSHCHCGCNRAFHNIHINPSQWYYSSCSIDRDGIFREKSLSHRTCRWWCGGRIGGYCWASIPGISVLVWFYNSQLKALTDVP